MLNHDVGSLMPLIKSIYTSLTKTEKKVAEFVIDYPEKVVYSSISDLADLVEVGDTTVLRFCRKTGYKGYQSFKVALAQEISISNKDIKQNYDEEISDTDSIWDVSQKTLTYAIQALNETLSLLGKDELEKAVSFILDANKIEVFGVGTSAVTSLDAKYRFARIGLNIDSSLDGHMQAMKSSLLTSSDVAIGVSFSGSTKDTVEVLALAKKRGAKTICITHFARSPITKYADVVLLNGSKEDPLEGGALASKMSQLLVIDILYNNIFLRMKNDAIKNKEMTSKAVMGKLF